MPTETKPKKIENGIEFLPYEFFGLTDEQRKAAKLELFEDEETKVHSLKLFRSMLNAEENLYYQDEDDFLISFLRSRKYDVTRTFSLMKTFYHTKDKRIELYGNFKYEDCTRAYNDNSMGYLPYRDPEGCVILIIKADSGSGLLTKERIIAGDIIVSIPENLLITPKKVLNLNLGKYFKRFHPKASGHQILSVFLMCEKAKHEASEWYPYMITLPESYDIPGFTNFFSSVCLPVSMNLYVKKQIKAVKKSYDQLKILFKNLELSFPLLHYTSVFDLYKWAWCTVNTRCVYIDCFLKNCPGKSCTYHLALAPYLDLLNHSSEVQVHAGFNKETKQYEIKSMVDFKKYSQVFINYGPHDNRTLLFEYGFILPDNQNDFVPFSDDDVTYAYKQCLFKSTSYPHKLKIMQQNNLFNNMNCSCDGISWNLSEVLKILSSDEEMK